MQTSLLSWFPGHFVKLQWYSSDSLLKPLLIFHNTIILFTTIVGLQLSPRLNDIEPIPLDSMFLCIIIARVKTNSSSSLIHDFTSSYTINRNLKVSGTAISVGNEAIE